MASSKQTFDGVAAVNAVREGLDGTDYNGASEAYQAAVPYIEGRSASIQDVGNPIINYQAIQNEFLDVLINRIAYTFVRDMLYENQLRSLISGNLPLGADLQEIGVNPAEARPFDPTGINLLMQEKPDVKVLYHRVNRKDRYKVTISDEQLRQAFVSWDSLDRFIAAIVNSMYNGAEMDEFMLMKQTLGRSVAKTDVTTITSTPVTDETSGKKLAAQIIGTSSAFTFPSTKYNKLDYKTWTPKDRQILIVRADVNANLNVEALAYAFNLDKIEFMGRVIEVDDFGAATNVMAMLVDESFLQVWDQLKTTREFYNAEGMYWNYFFHVWQVYSYSLLANAVAFVDGSTPSNTITGVTVSPTTAALNKGTSLTFDATVAGTGVFDETVNWTVTGGVAGTVINRAGTLSVSPAETAATLTVTATAVGDNTKSGTATVTVNGNIAGA